MHEVISILEENGEMVHHVCKTVHMYYLLFCETTQHTQHDTTLYYM